VDALTCFSRFLTRAGVGTLADVDRHGQAVFIATPALDPGWYMYQFQSCD